MSVFIDFLAVGCIIWRKTQQEAKKLTATGINSRLFTLRP